MKSKTVAVLCALCLFAAFGAATLRAEEYAVRINIPFAFVVGNETMEAGEYVISRLRTTTPAHVIKNHKVGTMTMTQEESWFKGPTSSVVFNRYGDRYFLHSICSAESETVYQLPKSKLETELIGQGSGPAVEMLAAMTR